MKAIVKTDNRPERDKYYDKLWDRFVRDAKLTPMQARIAHEYLMTNTKERLREFIDINFMASILALIENFGWGTTATSTRIPRFRNAVNDILEEVFDHQSLSGDVMYKYDGCGFERLRIRLHRHGVEYDAYYTVPEEERKER